MREDESTQGDSTRGDSTRGESSRGESSRPREGAHPVLWAMAAVMLGFELMFAAQRLGLLPEALARFPVYTKLAFWDVLFEEALAGQRLDPALLWSLVTHALLHGGWLHLVLNGAVFLALGNALVRAIGVRRFLVAFAATSVAGALLFGLLADVRGPLVGASGAIFGFLAMVTAWQEQALRRRGLSRAPIWKRIAGLVALNAILDFGLGGLLAWEAHLGGWIAGWLLAYAFPPGRQALRIL